MKEVYLINIVEDNGPLLVIKYVRTQQSPRPTELQITGIPDTNKGFICITNLREELLLVWERDVLFPIMNTGETWSVYRITQGVYQNLCILSRLVLEEHDVLIIK
ncbi:MAG: hypothetical protein V2A54_02425 [Bacteroidota bacterium]